MSEPREIGMEVSKPEVDVTNDYIRIRQKDPSLFKKETFRTITISAKKGIKAVIGRLKDPPAGKEGMVAQSYLFDKSCI